MKTPPLKNALLEIAEAEPDRHVTQRHLRGELSWSGSKIKEVIDAASEQELIESYSQGSQTCYRRIR